jgi:hypothetical protein
MRTRMVGSMMVVATTVLAIGVAVRPGAGQTPARGQAPTRGQSTQQPAAAASTYRGPRNPDGKPNLNGIWEALNTANYDLLAHAGGPSPVLAMGAAGAIPPGPGVVEGNEIPYTPAALAKKKDNAAHSLTMDPEVKCYMPGVPRATYMPYPFQIVQSTKTILIAYEYASTSRSIPITTRKAEAPVDTWMGDSVASWEGDTLVVDAKSFNNKSWFDRAGDFHSDALRVVERYTPVDGNIINYGATIEDPNVFTRPWKISMPLYRHVEKNAQLIEFKCVEFVEELMYGNLKKK